MDEYAMLLKLKSDPLKLNKLVHDLLTIDPARPEVYVALSVMCERKDERAALANAEKVRLIFEVSISTRTYLWVDRSYAWSLTGQVNLLKPPILPPLNFVN